MNLHTLWGQRINFKRFNQRFELVFQLIEHENVSERSFKPNKQSVPTNFKQISRN